MNTTTTEMQRVFDLYFKTNNIEKYKITIEKLTEDNTLNPLLLLDQSLKESHIIKYENEDLDNIIKHLPHPYNKKDIAKTIKKIHLYTQLKETELNNIQINLKIFVDIKDQQFKTKAGQNFERYMLTNNNITETYYFNNHSDTKYTQFASKTGMKSSYKKILTNIIEFLKEKANEQYDYSDNPIIDNTFDVDDYESDLYAMSIDYHDDFTLIKELYDFQLSNYMFKQFKYDGSLIRLIQSVYATNLLLSIDSEKIKVLLGYILKYQPDHISIIDLFNTQIPKNLITSRYMPKLNLKPITF